MHEIFIRERNLHLKSTLSHTSSKSDIYIHSDWHVGMGTVLYHFNNLKLHPNMACIDEITICWFGFEGKEA